MPEKATIQRAKEDLREGKSPTTAAGEFVRQEMEHIRQGKHGARSPKQAIAIGLSEARRAGVPLPPPAPGKAKEKTRRSAELAYGKGQRGAKKKTAPRISRVRREVLKREPRSSASRRALSKQAREAARETRSSKKKDLNRATKGQLMRVREFNVGRADDLIETRNRLGRFRSWKDVEKAPGFNSGMVRRLKDAGFTLRKAA